MSNRSDKSCTSCGVFKLISEYDVCRVGKNGMPTYYGACRRCRADTTYIWMRRHVFAKRYGITLEQYERMHQEQGGLCAICGEAEWVIQSGKVRMLSVDHDHLTGKVRGLLCASCNRAIGLLKDNTDTLKKAIRYLESEGDYTE